MKMNRINYFNKEINPITFFVGGRAFDSYKEDAARNNLGSTVLNASDKGTGRNRNPGKTGNSGSSGREPGIDSIADVAMNNVLDWLIEEKV